MTTILFSKTDLEYYIQVLSKISYLFRDSQLLRYGGSPRNEKLMSFVHSYAGILGYYYEVEYRYGRMSDIVDNEIASRFMLIKSLMSDPVHRETTIGDLADNWSDILQVIFNMQLESNPEGDSFKRIEQDIQNVTSAFEKLSGKKCNNPKDPRCVTPKRTSYNPFNISEDVSLAEGHFIPDITHVFAQELMPQLASCEYSGKSPKDIVADYAIGMIQSYYDNAGFVPMRIVDQITGQINQVASMMMRVSYSPCNTLKEYVLSKIYR